MTIPLGAILFLYFLILLFFITYSLFNIYHLLRFGFFSLTNLGIILGYLTISFILIWVSFNLLTEINWSQPLFELAEKNTELF